MLSNVAMKSCGSSKRPTNSRALNIACSVPTVGIMVIMDVDGYRFVTGKVIKTYWRRARATAHEKTLAF